MESFAYQFGFLTVVLLTGAVGVTAFLASLPHYERLIRGSPICRAAGGTGLHRKKMASQSGENEQQTPTVQQSVQPPAKKQEESGSTLTLKEERLARRARVNMAHKEEN